MKKAICLLCLLLLTGCSESSELERGMALRGRLLQAASCSFDAEVTADYGETVYSFALSCVGDPKGNLTFTVAAPESIAGITGSISAQSGALTFDETALQFDLLADGQTAPVTAPWIVLNTLMGGYLTAAGKEESGLRLTLDDRYEEDALTVDVWLNGEDLPERAEILYDGRRILSLTIRNFTIV